MTTDFLDAHRRHQRDAETLHGLSRLPNADHLYGIAAECGLKRLMLAFGMPFDTGRDAPKRRRDKTHINEIWKRYETYRSGDPFGAAYSLPSATNPFSHWDASQRYAHQSNFDSARVARHQTAARSVRQLVRKAQLNGLI